MMQASDETLGELVMIERTLWENNARVYHDTYDPEAILIFPDVGRIDRETAVAAIQKENAEGRAWAEVQFDDAVGRWLTTGTAVLLTYCATARWNDEAVSSRTLCATVYIRHRDAWRVAFHQQTPKTIAFTE
jgi:Domain of unknown function (DUF4440)